MINKSLQQVSATKVSNLWDSFEVLKAQVELMAAEQDVSPTLMYSMLSDYASRQLLTQIGR